VDPRDPYHARRIADEADLLRDLAYLGAVTLRKRKRTIGFEQRLERADDRPRVEGGSYIDHEERW
jgi:hypothetical protein